METVRPVGRRFERRQAVSAEVMAGLAVPERTAVEAAAYVDRQWVDLPAQCVG